MAQSLVLRALATLFVVCSLVGPTGVGAAPITVPSGLNPGDQYRLAFVTSAMRDAVSTDIADYNSFVTGVANGVAELAALGTTWTAIGSTALVLARDNTSTDPGAGVGLPIYRLDDTQIAVDNADLWDGALLVPLRVDETGTLIASPYIVWTGTNTAGGIGAGPLGATAVTLGTANHSNSTWIDTTISTNETLLRRIYAISGTLTVIPEPGTATLMALGICALAVVRRRKI